MPDTILLLFLGLAAGMIGAFIVARQMSRNTPWQNLMQQLQALDTQQKILSEQQNHNQQNFSQGLQKQERDLSQSLGLQLSQMGEKIDRQLDQSKLQQNNRMSDLQERLGIIDRASRNITSLSEQVDALRNILSNNQLRGVFGEQTMESIIRDQLPSSIYKFQEHLHDHNRDRPVRADCILTLPKPNKPIVIDAKFPRDIYGAYILANNKERKDLHKGFTANIQKHIRNIGDKYVIQGLTADNAIMFIPSESIFATIHHDCPDMADFARRHKVLITSPSTLWALIYAINAVLHNVRIQEQAGIIQKEAGIIVSDIKRLDKRIDNLDSHFRKANKDIREIRISGDKIVDHGERLILVDIEKENDGSAPPLPERPLKEIP